MKPSTEHIAFLDYFRGVAILGVLAIHLLMAATGIGELPWNGWLRSWDVGWAFLLLFPATFGGAGVPIFFAVSGFCIHLSHARSQQNGFRVFFLRRFFRIYPPYLLALLFSVILFYLTHYYVKLEGNPFPSFQQGIGEVVSHLFLVHNFSDASFVGHINAPMWSIAVEVQLYLLYPLVLWLTSRLGWSRTLALTAVVELGLRATSDYFYLSDPAQELHRVFTGSPFYFWFSWSVGAVLAEAYLKGKPLPFRGPLLFLWPLLFFAFYFYKPLVVFTFPLASLVSVSLMAYLLARPSLHVSQAGWIQFLLAGLRWMGLVSYSAYLLHEPILHLMEGLTAFLFPHSRFLDLFIFIACLASMIPILGLSYLFYRYVEQPSIAWGKRVIARNQVSAATTDSLKA